MAIQLKRSATTGNAPSSLVAGEVAINEADGLLFYRNGSGSVASISLPSVRKKLTADTAFYVGYTIGAPTISIASPAVATLASHGLSAGSRVVFSVARNTQTCTITEANPGVITLNSHGYAAGQPVVFSSSGYLPHNLVAGTTYYVISTGLATNTFQVSTSVGGSAVNTTAMTNTFVNGSTTVTTSATHNLKVGQIIRFSGTNVGNVSNATNYYVLTVPSSTTFTFSATSDGTAITAGTVTTQGTFVANGTHTVCPAGSLPTGVTEGTAYYVLSTGLTSSTFQFSTTAGGTAVNTSGSVTGTPVYTAYTGGDTNTGRYYVAADALLTVQAAVDIITSQYDLGGYTATISVAAGTFTGGVTFSAPWANGNVKIVGAGYNKTTFSTTSASAITISAPLVGNLTLDGIKLMTTTSGHCILISAAASVYIQSIEFGSSAADHMSVSCPGAFLSCPGDCIVTGSASRHIYSSLNSVFNFAYARTLTFFDVPAFGQTVSLSHASICWHVNTCVGSATGTRYLMYSNSVLDTQGGGATYLPGNGGGAANNGAQYL